MLSGRLKATAALAGAVIWTACGGNHETSRPETADPVVNAAVEIVSKSETPLFYEAVGTVQSRTTSDLSSRTVGQVTAVLVREGQRVRKGQTLVEIDSRDSRTQLRRAEAGVQEAEAAGREVERAIEAARSARQAAQAQARLAAATYQRHRELLERKSVSPQEFDEAEARHRAAEAEVSRTEAAIKALEAKKQQVGARLSQAEAEVGNARVFVSYSRVAAPFAGLVIGKHVDPGDLATPGLPLVTLEDPSQYRLEAIVQESKIQHVKAGQEVPVRIDALEAELAGVVDEIGPRADPASRSFSVRINLPGAAALRSGMFGRARFPLGRRELLTIPASALILKGQLTGVYVVGDENRASFRLVRTGEELGEQVEILSGLKEGEKVVAFPGPAVRDGIRIGGA